MCTNVVSIFNTLSPYASKTVFVDKCGIIDALSGRADYHLYAVFGCYQVMYLCIFFRLMCIYTLVLFRLHFHITC